MEIVKLEDVNVTIKIITVDGKKMAKTYFDQIPFDVYMSCKNDDYSKYSSADCNHPLKIGYGEDYTTNGKYVGFIRKDVVHSSNIKFRFHSLNYSVPENTRFYPILFINADGKLRRSYISDEDIQDLNLEETQIFI